MLKELLSIARAVVQRNPKIVPPTTLQYDHNTDQFVMFDIHRHIVDFALTVGIWPSSLIKYETHMAYAVWAGHSARTLKKRVE
jgi:hypothetical protein